MADIVWKQFKVQNNARKIKIELDYKALISENVKKKINLIYKTQKCWTSWLKYKWVNTTKWTLTAHLFLHRTILLVVSNQFCIETILKKLEIWPRIAFTYCSFPTANKLNIIRQGRCMRSWEKQRKSKLNTKIIS